MNDQLSSPSRVTSSRPSRYSFYSRRRFDYFDTSHSVFSQSSYYDDKMSIHPWLRRPYSRYSGIALSTLRAGPCSIRTDQLAQPKVKREYLIRQEFFDNFTNYSYSGVNSATMTAECSQRSADLARPKSTPTGYREAYILPREVPEGALQARPTNRLNELAKPRHNLDTYKKSLWNNGR